MEKQKVIIDQLKGKLPLDLGEFDKLSTDELRMQVDNAIGQVSIRHFYFGNLFKLTFNGHRRLAIRTLFLPGTNISVTNTTHISAPSVG